MRAQVLVEFTLAAAGLCVLTLLTVRVAHWLNESMVERNQSFQATRAQAARPPDGILESTPGSPGRGFAAPSRVHLIGPGPASASGVPPQGSGPSAVPPACTADDKLFAEAKGFRDQADTLNDQLQKLRSCDECLPPRQDVKGLETEARDRIREAIDLSNTADRIHDRIVAIDTRLGQIDTRMQQIDSGVAAIDARIPEINTRLAQISGEIAALGTCPGPVTVCGLDICTSIPCPPPPPTGGGTGTGTTGTTTGTTGDAAATIAAGVGGTAEQAAAANAALADIAASQGVEAAQQALADAVAAHSAAAADAEAAAVGGTGTTDPDPDGNGDPNSQDPWQDLFWQDPWQDPW